LIENKQEIKSFQNPLEFGLDSNVKFTESRAFDFSDFKDNQQNSDEEDEIQIDQYQKFENPLS